MASISKYTKDNKQLYRVQVYLGINPYTGLPVKTTRSGFKTIKAAELEVAKLKLAFERGDLFSKQVNVNSTFEEIYFEWIEAYEKTVEPSTFYKTKKLFENHILPNLGKYRMKQITINQVQKIVNEWADNLVHYKQLRSYSSQIFKYAIVLEVLEKNPMEHVKLPKKKKAQPSNNYYSKEELNIFLESLNGSSVKEQAFFYLIANTGIRVGEAVALYWEDVDFVKSTLSISKAIGRSDALYMKSTKTGDNRCIDLDSNTIEKLKNWKTQYIKLYGRIQSNKGSSKQLMFPNAKGTWHQPSTPNVWLKKIQKKFNFKKISVHGFRHTHCTLLFESGATLKAVQDRLGHSDATTTLNIYTHVTKKAKDDLILNYVSYMKSNELDQ